MYETTQGGGIGAITWLIILAIYLYFAYCQFKIAQKVGQNSTAWWAFIPVLNIFQWIQLAGRPWYWFIFCLIPFVNIIIMAVLWIDVARACNQSPLLGILMILPFLNLIALGVLAFTGSPKPMPSPTTKQPSRQPERVG